MMFKTENDELMTAFLERTFYTRWRNPEGEHLQNFSGLEFMLNARCNLACKYCYLNRFGDQLFPEELNDDKAILRNTDALIKWIKENNFYPKIELFTGETFVQPVAFEVLRRIIDELGEPERERKVVIPTNFTFLLNEELTEKVEALIQRGLDNNVRLIFSASFDGKYCEGNRPFKSDVASSEQSLGRIWSWKYKGLKDPRDDDYYDRAFAFAKKHSFGFHPMIYGDHIEDWKKNFLWFQENFKKTGHPWQYLYLLEIRNVEWSDKQLQDYMEFIKFLWRWSYNQCGRNIKNLFNFLFEKKGFNILSAPLTTVGRGLGCSIQASLQIRLGDLAFGPCHRTCYEHFLYGRFKVESGIQEVGGYTRKDGVVVDDYVKDSGDKIVGVEAKNVELMIGIISMNSANWPYCESCLINPLCNKGCLGSQYEVTGDLFTPIPTVCRMYHAKMRAMVEVLTELKIFDAIVGRVNDDKRRALITLRKMLAQTEGLSIKADIKGGEL